MKKWFAAVAAAMVLSAPASADDLCIALHRVLLDTPNYFRSLEGESIGTGPREVRRATIVLPAAAGCVVSAGHQYECSWRPPSIGNTPKALQAFYADLTRRIPACFPPARIRPAGSRTGFLLPEGEIGTFVDTRNINPRVELVVSAWGPRPLAGWYHHQPKFDATGYYLPVAPVAAGTWRLRNLTIGTPRELADFAAGRRPPASYAPFIIELENAASPTEPDGNGEAVPVGQARILPSAYDISPNFVRFRARDRRFGEVTFEGKFDAAALARAKNAAATSTPETVLIGRLTIGTLVLDGLKFSWTIGD